MIDIYKFIDSEAIREYNRKLKTDFTALEMSVIITLSERTDINEKIDALDDILKNYDEMAFKANFPYTNSDFTPKEIVQSQLDMYKEGLYARIIEHSDIVFKASVWETEVPDVEEIGIFSSYDKAYEYLRQSYSYYRDDEDSDFRNTKLSSNITSLHLDKSENEWVFQYDFDNDMRIYNVHKNSVENEDAGYIYIGDFFIYVPLPFRKGDILKFRCYDGKYQYGILPYDADKNAFDFYFKHNTGDGSDMQLSVYYVEEVDGKQVYNYGHIPFLSLEAVTYDEVPEEQRNLILLREVYRNRMELCWYLFATSRGETEEYLKMYGESIRKEWERERNDI